MPAKPVTDPPPPKGIIIEDDANVATQEPACRLFQMTTKDVSIEPVPWKMKWDSWLQKNFAGNITGGALKTGGFQGHPSSGHYWYMQYMVPVLNNL